MRTSKGADHPHEPIENMGLSHADSVLDEVNVDFIAYEDAAVNNENEETAQSTERLPSRQLRLVNPVNTATNCGVWIL